jgi:hypothetical protein
MEFIQVAYGKFVSEACAQTIFVDGDYLNNACVKLTISKILGVAIVLGSIIGDSLNCISSYFSESTSDLQVCQKQVL